LHYGLRRTVIEFSLKFDRSRDAVAGLIKRGLRQLRAEMAAAAHESSGCPSGGKPEGEGG
jgi:hypothetical protein